MTLRVRHISIISLALLLDSCSVMRPDYSSHTAGIPASPGYTPRGTVEEVYYSCSVPGPTRRRMIVYLPEGYYDNDARYPVVYLLHGARGYETAWIEKGSMLQLTDSLYANNLAVPAIVVMPNVNQYDDDADYANSRPKGPLESIFEIDGVVESGFLRDVVSFVDSLYRTIPDRQHRAIAGLSVGGRQSITIAANEPDFFGWVGSFSPYMPVRGKNSRYRDYYGNFKGKLDSQFLLEPPEGFYLMNGRSDHYSLGTRKFHRHLVRKGYQHTWVVTPGGHDWPNWKEYYTMSMQMFFRDDKQEEL